MQVSPLEELAAIASDARRAITELDRGGSVTGRSALRRIHLRAEDAVRLAQQPHQPRRTRPMPPGGIVAGAGFRSA